MARVVLVGVQRVFTQWMALEVPGDATRDYCVEQVVGGAGYPVGLPEPSRVLTVDNSSWPVHESGACSAKLLSTISPSSPKTLPA